MHDQKAHPEILDLRCWHRWQVRSCPDADRIVMIAQAADDEETDFVWSLAPEDAFALLRELALALRPIVMCPA